MIFRNYLMIKKDKDKDKTLDFETLSTISS